MNNKYNRIIIDSIKLINIINDNYPKYNKQTLSYFSVFITLAITLFTIEEYKDFGSILTSLQIKYLLIFVCITALVLSIYEFFRKPSHSKDIILEQIENESQNITKNIALFVFMHDFVEPNGIRVTKFLFSDDREWSSYLLPFCKIYENKDTDFLSMYIENQLSLVPKSAKLKEIDSLEFVEEKNSATSGKMTLYSYWSYYVVVDSRYENQHIYDKSFNIGKRNYCWLSLEEVKEHSKTMYLNRKVIRMLDDNFSKILMDFKQPHS